MNYIILYGAQTSVCVKKFIFTDELHSCSYDQTVNSDRFLEMLFCTHSFTSLLRIGSLNCAANSAGGERLRREGETSRSRGETGDIILLNESLRFIQNVLVAMRFVLQKSR